MKKENPKYSHQIEDLLNLFNTIESDYAWNCNEVNRLDKLTQDYLHDLELGNLNYSERSKVATKLSQCRKLRRESKDTVEILEPFYDFLINDKGKNIKSLTQELLGKTRKIENHMKNRTYRYKVERNNTYGKLGT